MIRNIQDQFDGRAFPVYRAREETTEEKGGEKCSLVRNTLVCGRGRGRRYRGARNIYNRIPSAAAVDHWHGDEEPIIAGARVKESGQVR